jgi:alpha-glucoside transport system substrate-binding protein
MRRTWLVVTCLAIVGCGGGTDATDGPRVIDVFGPYRDVEADNFAASLQQFEDDTGLIVRYTGSSDFVKDLKQRLESGISAPDIAIVPQPGVVDELVATDRLVPLDETSVQTLFDNYPAELIEQSTTGEIFSAPSRESIKSLVWYRPSVFEQRGWAVPTTLDELSALVRQIERERSDGSTIAPWCFAMQSGSATGWAATDWVEDLVLRIAGPGVYDEWVAGRRGFDDPAIREAFITFDELVLTEGRTIGGLRNILQTEVSRAGDPLFADEPGCAMYKQASFAESWFPDGTEIGTDVDFFVLPGTDANASAPLVAGGDSLVQFSDNPDVDRLMAYLISPDGLEIWAGRGGFYSGLTTVDLDTYYSETDRRFAELFRDGRDLRFDASDLMPSEIGSGLLWREITAWISGTTTLDEFVATMDAAYAGADQP